MTLEQGYENSSDSLYDAMFAAAFGSLEESRFDNELIIRVVTHHSEVSAPRVNPSNSAPLPQESQGSVPTNSKGTSYSR